MFASGASLYYVFPSLIVNAELCLFPRDPEKEGHRFQGEDDAEQAMLPAR